MTRKGEVRLVYSTGGEKEQPQEERASSTPSAGGIRLRLERRAGNRVVTTVTALPGAPDEIETLAKAIKTACSTGGSLKDAVLELQGDHRDRVEALLLARGLRSKRAGG